MTIAPKSIALVAALMAQAVFVSVSPASAIPISFSDVHFLDVETREGCYFVGNCDDSQTVTKQQSDANAGSAAPKMSPRASTNGDR
ncbi:MAG: hypothetical protein AAFR49_14625 [Pseudomonadota bacterium]